MASQTEANASMNRSWERDQNKLQAATLAAEEATTLYRECAAKINGLARELNALRNRSRAADIHLSGVQAELNAKRRL